MTLHYITLHYITWSLHNFSLHYIQHHTIPYILYMGFITYTTYMHAYVHTCMYICIHAYIHTYIHTWIYEYICMHACMNAYKTYIHIWLHTSIYLYFRTNKMQPLNQGLIVNDAVTEAEPYAFMLQRLKDSKAHESSPGFLLIRCLLPGKWIWQFNVLSHWHIWECNQQKLEFHQTHKTKNKHVVSHLHGVKCHGFANRWFSHLEVFTIVGVLICRLPERVIVGSIAGEW